MRHTALLLPLLLAACSTLSPPDTATLDCPALAREVGRTAKLLVAERTNPRPPVTLNIGLGGAVGSHGSIGVGFGLPIGTPKLDDDRIQALQQQLARLQALQRQRQCPPTTP